MHYARSAPWTARGLNEHRAGAPIGASVQHSVNLQLRPEGLGSVCAERSNSTNHDNKKCQVEAVVGFNC